MQKKYAIIILVFLAVLVVIMITFITMHRPKGVNRNIAFEDFDLTDLQNSKFKINDTSKTYILVFVKTDCGYCIEESIDFYDNIDQLSNTVVVFVASAGISELKHFAQNNTSERIKFVSDTDKQLSNLANIKSYPTTIIYRFAKQEPIIFIGYTDTQKIISALTK